LSEVILLEDFFRTTSSSYIITKEALLSRVHQQEIKAWGKGWADGAFPLLIEDTVQANGKCIIWKHGSFQVQNLSILLSPSDYYFEVVS